MFLKSFSLLVHADNHDVLNYVCIVTSRLSRVALQFKFVKVIFFNLKTHRVIESGSFWNWHDTGHRYSLFWPRANFFLYGSRRGPSRVDSSKGSCLVSTKSSIFRSFCHFQLFLLSRRHIVNSRLSGWTIIYHEVFFRLKICAVFFCFVVNTHGHREPQS